MLVAERIVRELRARGVDCVFGVAGSSILGLLEALRATGTRYVSCRSENGAVLMALGYARATRRPSVCLVSSGPGVAFGTGGVSAAHRGRVPLLLLSGGTPRALKGLGAFQDLDTVALLGPVTKCSMTLGSPGAVTRVVDRLWTLANAGRRGPVHLCVPTDVLAAPAPADRVRPEEAPTLPSAPAPEAVATIIARLRRARRPLLFVGDEVIWSSASALCLDLADRLGIPGITPLTNPDAFPTSHPLGLGPLGPHGWESARFVVQHADLVLALGTALDHFSTGFRPNLLRPSAQLIQVGPAASDDAGFYRPSLTLTCDVAPFLRSLLAGLGPPGPQPAYWRGVPLRQVRTRCVSRYARPGRTKTGPLRVAQVAAALRARMRSTDALVCDSGNFEYQVYRHFPTREPGTFFYGDDFGAMGTSLPVGLGVQLADRERRVVILCGDGGMCSMLAELETAVRERLNPVIVIVNDSSYGSIKAYQLARLSRHVFGVDHGNPDYAALAESFGARGFRVTGRHGLRRALTRAWPAREPVVIEVRLSAPELATPAF